MREANFSRVCKMEPDARVVEEEVSNREKGGTEEQVNREPSIFVCSVIQIERHRGKSKPER